MREPRSASGLAAAGTVGVLACAVLAWKRRYWGPFGRLHYSIVALSAVTFVALLAHYRRGTSIALAPLMHLRRKGA